MTRTFTAVYRHARSCRYGRIRALAAACWWHINGTWGLRWEWLLEGAAIGSAAVAGYVLMRYLTG